MDRLACCRAQGDCDSIAHLYCLSNCPVPVAGVRSVPRLPAPAGAADPAAPSTLGDMAQRKDKWKARCKEVQSKLEATASAAQAVEAALRAQLADAERAAAQHAAQQASMVAALQGRVEELATAGAQLEGALQQTARQLADAAGAGEALRGQLDRERAEHAEAVAQAERRLQAAEVGGGGWACA